MRTSMHPVVERASSFLLLLAAAALMPSAASGQILARIPVDRSLADVSLPVHAHLKGADGSEYALVFAPAERLALDTRARALARVSRAGEVIVARERRSGARAAAPGLAEVLFDDGRHVVARADEAQAEALARAGFDLLRLPDTPMVLAAPAPAALRAPTPWDSRVASMAAQVTESAVYGLARGLTGVEPVTVGGTPYTIRTRHTTSGTPIQMATQLAYERLSALGLATSYHAWTRSGFSNRNVVAELPGVSRPSEIVLVGAHLDDMPSGGTAPGADDNASGSTGVLLAAEILASHRFERTIRFVLFTGEEQGLLGSTVYATLLASQSANVVAVLNLDMIGYDGDGIPALRLHTRLPSNPGYPGDLAIAEPCRSAVSYYVGAAVLPIVEPVGESASDHSPFWNRGWPAILAIEDDVDDFTPDYHTTRDTLATLDPAYFTSYVKASVATAAHLAMPETHPTLFEPVAPCRVLDTRDGGRPAGLGAPALAAWEVRPFSVISACGIPADAAALAVNVTAVGPAAGGDLTLWPGLGLPPGTSNVSFAPGRVRASFSTLTLGSGATFAVRNGSAGPVHVVVDVSGFFR